MTRGEAIARGLRSWRDRLAWSRGRLPAQAGAPYLYLVDVLAEIDRILDTEPDPAAVVLRGTPGVGTIRLTVANEYGTYVQEIPRADLDAMSVERLGAQLAGMLAQVDACTPPPYRGGDEL